MKETKRNEIERKLDCSSGGIMTRINRVLQLFCIEQLKIFFPPSSSLPIKGINRISFPLQTTQSARNVFSKQKNEVII